MLIRACYHPFFEQIINKPDNYLIIGTPGIGKSMFVYYAMWKLLQVYPSTTIAWWPNGLQSVILLASDGTTSHCRPENLQEILPQGSFVFIDSNKPPSYWRSRTILVTSPNSSHIFKEFKEKTNCQVRYMPVWSGDEVFKYCQVATLGCTKDGTTDELSGDIGELFKKVGGIPRILFSKVDLQTQTNELTLAIDQYCTEHKIGGPLFDSNREVFHLIVHYYPAPDYKSYTFVFASNWVFQQVSSEFFALGQSELVNLIKNCREPETGTLIGLLFEYYSHRQLSCGGEYIVRCLSDSADGNQETMTIPKRVDLFSFDGVEKLKLESGYYKPKQKNFAAVDSIYVDTVKKVVNFFQITKAASHKINGEGMLKLVNTFNSLKSGVRLTYRLYFVLPSFIYEEYYKRPQRFEWSKKINTDENLKGSIEQYALCIPLKPE